ncbi:hypothetical protein D9M68_830260 [compost metagenome]
MHLLCITQYRKIGVVRGEDELGLRFHPTKQLNHIVVDGLVVQIVFGLVDDDGVVLPLAEDIEQQG